MDRRLQLALLFVGAYFLLDIAAPMPPLLVAVDVDGNHNYNYGKAIIHPGELAGRGPTLNGRGACVANPYRSSVANTSFDAIIDEASRWLDFERPLAEIIARHSNYSHHDHARFFPFQAMAPCDDLQCVGGACSDDVSKIACGMDYLGRLDDCVVYSIGGNNQWQFELDMLRRTKCQIHTFDCTGPRSRFDVPEHERLHFHRVCLGSARAKGLGDDHPKCNREKAGTQLLCGDTWTLEEIQRHLGHDEIDLLKLDIEGWEWPIFDIESTNASMPMELLVEVHYRWHGIYAQHDRTIESAGDLVRLQANLMRLGYVVVVRDDNPHCPHCTELTLLRVAC